MCTPISPTAQNAKPAHFGLAGAWIARRCLTTPHRSKSLSQERQQCGAVVLLAFYPTLDASTKCGVRVHRCNCTILVRALDIHAQRPELVRGVLLVVALCCPYRHRGHRSLAELSRVSRSHGLACLHDPFEKSRTTCRCDLTADSHGREPGGLGRRPIASAAGEYPSHDDVPPRALPKWGEM